MKQAHVYISGFVQGVGFRAFVRSKARKIGVTGWVRNLSDGRVEGIFQGDEEKIKKVISYCKKGPFFGKVTDIVVEWEDAEFEYMEFSKEATV